MTELTPVMKKIILHWGEMGSSWGINRTIAQIYALLYLSSNPLTADEICETLALARSTVSSGLHELQAWGVVKVVHVLGDRRDHFTTMSDIWEMFRAILNERKRREVDPTVSVLQESLKDYEQEDDKQPYVEKRLQEMLELFEAITSVYDQVESLPTETLKSIVKMGDSVTKIINRIDIK